MSKKTAQKNARKKYAPIALWVALAALLSTAIFGFIKLLASLELLTLPNSRFVNAGMLISVGLVLIGIAVFILIDPKGFLAFIAGRQARHGSNAVIMLIAFLVILVVGNLWAYHSGIEKDLTVNSQFTLAPETIDTLSTLPEPVMVYAFYTDIPPSARELFSDLETRSDGNFDYEFVDPDAQPGLAQQYGYTRNTPIILVAGDRREAIAYADEQSIVNALYRLINPGQRTIYFLTGHGEHNITSSDDTGYSNLRTLLESKNYTVQTLNLLTGNQIPDDATLIVIAGPIQPLSADEVALLSDYLASGGSLILLSEPPFITQSLGRADPLADSLATDWGLALSNDLIIDTTLQDPLIAVSEMHANHPITQALQTTATFYPTARSIVITSGAVETISRTELVATSQRSWGETDFASLDAGQVSFDPEADTPGPLTLAIAVQNPDSNARLVIIGDSDFASNGFFDTYGNGDLIANAIDWAAQIENMVTLTSAEPVSRSLRMTSQTAVLLLGAAFVCIIPLLIIVGGVIAWLVRRSQG